MKLYDILAASAREAVKTQRKDGSLPSGHNGPYHDPETPVRNTAHWLITFLHAHEVTDDDLYLDAAQGAIEYLTGPAARPHGATFHHRTTPDKDSCNGLIGQAWTIEALAVAAAHLERPVLAALAEKVFLLHPFDPDLALWKRVDIDGEPRSFDSTFNHQLWFAAAGGVLAQHKAVSPRVGRYVQRFLDELHINIKTYPSGLIYHPLHPSFSVRRYLQLATHDRRSRLAVIAAIRSLPLTDVELLRSIVRHPQVPLRRLPLSSKQLREKAIGYHSFNLYALSLLKLAYPAHEFWNSTTVSSIWDYAHSNEFVDRLIDNPYGYPYNPPGFEMAFALEVFKEGGDQEQEQWLSRQFQRCYDPDTQTLRHNTPDPATLTARLYETTRLPDRSIRLE